MSAQKPEVGDVFKVDMGGRSVDRRLCHVRAVADDRWVIVRYWTRGDWQYQMLRTETLTTPPMGTFSHSLDPSKVD